MAVETSAERAAAVSKVLTATQAEPDKVKEAAINALVAAEDGRVADTAVAVEKVINDSKGAPASVRAAAISAVAEGPIGRPPPERVIGLWWALVVGLLILLFVTLIGLLWTILDSDNATSADKVLIVFTPLLTGLLGLFAPSPRQTSSESQSTG
jgi:hypothetical protein